MVEDNERTLALMNETGYEIQQDNGQRIYGPPPDWDGPAPKETEIFIGKLPNDVYEYDLVPLFSSCGKIYMLRIMQNFSGLNRGFAFVQYTRPDEADKAIRLLNNVEIRPGEKIGVVKSRNNCRLYIGKLDQTMTREEIKKELEILTEDIVDVIIHKNEVEGLNNRGYAFVDYQTHKAAAKARRKLVPCKIKIRGHEIQVDWATPCHESGDSLSIQTSLLIKNLRQTCKNDELVYYYSLRNKFKIIKFKRLPTQALISFNSKQEAEFAMRIYNEIKDSKEFNYFAEKDKRVEIVWLKNTMDLSPFSSSVNYPLPKVFQAPQCCQPNHQQRSNFLNANNDGSEMGNQQAANRPNGSTGNRNGAPNGQAVIQAGKAAYQANCSNGNCCSHPHGSSPTYQSSSSYQSSSGYQSSSSHQSSPAYSPSGISPTNRSGSPTYPNGLSNSLYQALSKCTGAQRFVPTHAPAMNGTMRPPFSQPSALQAPPGFNGGHCANAGKFSTRNGSMDGHMFSNRVPIANRQHPPPTSLNLRGMSANLGADYNPFSARLGNPANRQPNHTTGPPHRPSQGGLPFTSTPTGEENPFTAKGFAVNPATWNAHRNRAAGYSANGQLNSSASFASKSPLDKSPAPLNASYNFGIWQADQNLDASANWSKCKERKIVKRSAFGSSSETNISEEDSCSLKSDPDSSSCSPDSFNCFNPVHSLNLADNFRSLTTENCQRLPVCPVLSNQPVLQQ